MVMTPKKGSRPSADGASAGRRFRSSPVLGHVLFCSSGRFTLNGSAGGSFLICIQVTGPFSAAFFDPGARRCVFVSGPRPGRGQSAQPGRTSQAWSANTTSCARSRAPSLVIARLAWVFAVDALT